MINLKYSLVIEATEDPNFFGFYSPDLEGVTGVGNSIEDCLTKPAGVWKNTLLSSVKGACLCLLLFPTLG